MIRPRRLLFFIFTEKDFLRFFFKRLKPNKTSRFPEFPYVSPCGPEMNYVRCDDIPIVFTKVLHIDNETVLSYNNGEERLVFPFSPERVCMQPSTGRVYHPGPVKCGGVGLIKSLIAIEWSKDFHYENGTHEDNDPPTHFTWDGKKYKLSNDLFNVIAQLSALPTNMPEE